MNAESIACGLINCKLLRFIPSCSGDGTPHPAAAAHVVQGGRPKLLLQLDRYGYVWIRCFWLRVIILSLDGLLLHMNAISPNRRCRSDFHLSSHAAGAAGWWPSAIPYPGECFQRRHGILAQPNSQAQQSDRRHQHKS
jgi:hypothetical protein